MQNRRVIFPMFAICLSVAAFAQPRERIQQSLSDTENGSKLYNGMDLNGLWVGENYVCENRTIREKVIFVHKGNSVVATKKTGDACVPAGRTTFSGSIESGVNCHLGRPERPDSEISQGSITIRSKDLIEACGVRFTRSRSRPILSPTANDAKRVTRKVSDRQPDDPKNGKKCDYPTYKVLPVSSMASVIAQFENDVDEVATYDPDMPSERMFPNPIGGAANIPVKYMDFNDYRALTRMEEITEEVVTESGPDKALKSEEKKIRRLYKEAQQSYDLSARLADLKDIPCPKFSDPDAYLKILEADKIMKALRKRRDGYLKGSLFAGERLNEKLTRAFYGDLADASSLSEKQEKFLAELNERAKRALKSRLTDEAIESPKIEALVPRLDALRNRYSKLESEGKKVSQKTRDNDLKNALQRSGINYDPTLVGSAKSNGQMSMGKAGLDYLKSTLGPQATGFGKRLATAQGYFQAAMVTAESLNALKNYYSLFITEKELMPVALAVQENRAYLKGLVERYDILDQEYAIMRKKFEDAVTSGGSRSETD